MTLCSLMNKTHTFMGAQITNLFGLPKQRKCQRLVAVSTNIALYADILHRLSQPRIGSVVHDIKMFSNQYRARTCPCQHIFMAAHSGIRWSVCGSVLEGEWWKQRSAGNDEKHRYTPGAQTFCTC